MKIALTDICDFQGGTQPPKNEWIDHEAEGYVRMLQIRDFTQSEKENIEYVKNTKNLKKCNENDVLIGRYGASVGKILTGMSGAYNVAIVKAIPDKDKIYERYLYYFFNSPYFQNFIKGVGCRAAQAGFNKDDLKNAVVSLCSIDEQRKIASVLDKLSSLIAKRRQQLDKLDEMVKARFVEMFGDPATNPNGYLKIKVGEAVADGYIEKPLDGNHGEKHPKAAEYVDDGVPFIMANNITEHGKVDFIHCAHITPERALMLDKGFAQNMDVLITHKGTIGRTAVLHTNFDFVMLTPQVTYYRIKKGLEPYYLKEYFSSKYFQMKIANLAAAGGSTRAYAGITAQLNLPMLIPPMPLQNKFVRFIQKIEKSKTTISRSLEKLETLKKALMQECFG